MTVIGGGWICPDCNNWINEGETHTCPKYNTVHTGYYQLCSNHEKRVEEKLDRIIELLEKAIGEI